MNTPVPEMKTCKQCGQPMAGDAPEGLCARCLLSAAIKEPSGSGGPAPDLSSAPPPTEIGAQFPELEILSQLGRGGMGVVYKARQPALDRLVALKILTPEFAGDPHFAERFTREARALAKLSHPNIVTVHEFGQRNGQWYFLMEFIDGTNLRQLIQTHSIQPEQALAIVPKICEALQFAHEEGVMHRDIKPENILVDKKGRVKIADFGLAKLLGIEAPDSALTHTGMSLGTPRYMAPEQVEHPEKVDHRADIYSLGVVFYEMLTGELPMGRFAPPSHTAGVDARLDDVVNRSLEKNVDLRYQQASEVKTDVESIAGVLEKLPPAIRGMLGFEYRSKATIFGVPLLHMASGVDPISGQRRVARGIIALGDRAIGVFAFGGVAAGFFAVGGVGIGVLSFSGLALGLISFGGLALGLLFANGGFALAPFAIGGLAAGWTAAGGVAFAHHAAGGNAHDPVAQAFFRDWQRPANMLFLGLLPICIIGPLVLGLLGRRWARTAREGQRSSASRPPGAGSSAGFGTSVRTPPASSAPPAPRCSRLAIWGAIWAALFFLTVPILSFSWFAVEVVPQGQDSRSPLIMVLVLLIAIPGAGAPLGTTMLGGVAIQHIRQSAGRLYGLPLAVADVLLFPLLLLGALVAAPSGLILASILSAVTGARNLGPGEIILLGALPALAVCYFAARAVWRKASAGMPAGPAPGTANAPTAAGPQSHSYLWFIVAGVLLIAIGVPVAMKLQRPRGHVSGPLLHSITDGIGANFTVPAGQVAILEVVTRKSGATVAVPKLAAHILAPADRPAQATFRWGHDAKNSRGGRVAWKIEVETEGGKSSSGGLDLPGTLASRVGSMSVGIGMLEPDQEVVHWNGSDIENLPADGLIGLRIRTLAHGRKAGEPGASGGLGVGGDWKKTGSIPAAVRGSAVVQGDASPALEKESPSKAAAPASPADATALQARFEAALLIASNDARAKALSQVALDAATNRNSALAHQVLEQLNWVELKEQTAATCALDLAKQGDVAGAQKVANLIMSTELHDRTLSTIARGH